MNSKSRRRFEQLIIIKRKGIKFPFFFYLKVHKHYIIILNKIDFLLKYIFFSYK